MSRWHVTEFLSLLVCFAVATRCAWGGEAIELTVVTDRSDAIYRCGETASFFVSAKRGGSALTSGKFEYILTMQWCGRIASGVGHFGARPTVVKGTLGEPGILCCEVTHAASPKPVSRLGAAAFEPEKLRPVVEEPPDFKAFWEANKRALARVPMDVKLTKSAKYSKRDATVYKISLAIVDGSRAYGWLGVPTRKGPYPALLSMPAVAVVPLKVDEAYWARRGVLTLVLYLHGVDVDLSDEEYERLRKGPLHDCWNLGAESRETMYWRCVNLRCLRGVDYLASRPDWDGKHLLVVGSSNGGARAIATAALDPRVTAMAAFAPACCDTPRWFGRGVKGKERQLSDRDRRTMETWRYYDAANFARHITCPKLVTLGLLDTACRATDVYAAANVMQPPKQIEVLPLMGHDWHNVHNIIKTRWLRKHAGLRR